MRQKIKVTKVQDSVEKRAVKWKDQMQKLYGHTKMMFPQISDFLNIHLLSPDQSLFDALCQGRNVLNL
jgi:hypothetical protein